MTLRVFSRQIGVDQPQSGGDYPFVLPSDELDQLIGDLCLTYRDDACELIFPLSIQWLSGFGTNVVADPTGRTRSHELLIVDADGTTVFDSRDYDTLTETVWSDDYLVLEWSQATPVSESDYQLLRVVKYRTDISGDGVVWDTYIEPTRSVIDARALSPIPRLVRTLSVVTNADNPADDVVIDAGSNVVIQAGYNMLLEASSASVVDGTAQSNTIRFSAVPGAGIGRYPCVSEKYIRRINSAEADALGNVILDATGCYRLERPTDDVLLSSLSLDSSTLEESIGLVDEPARITLADNTLLLSNNCGPCCECQDFINVYEAIRKLDARYMALGLQAEAIRDQYAANKQRWEDERTRRATKRMRLAMQALGNNKVGVGFGICNNTDQPLTDIELRICFQYGPDANGVEAASSLPGCVLPHTTFMLGNTAPGVNSPCRRVPYELEGTWPSYSARFDCIDPGRIGVVTTAMTFVGGITGDRVEAVARAFGVDTANAEPAADSIELVGRDVELCCDNSSSSLSAEDSSLCNPE